MNNKTAILPNNENNDNAVDLVLFMGQSNMAGRGVASEAPIVNRGYGYEFRSITDPTKLYDIVEPFGVNENSARGINDVNFFKTGTLVSSFINVYYPITRTPIVAVSASQGGTSILQWQPNGELLNDAIKRATVAKEWLLTNQYVIKQTFMVWCQGETDGDNGMSELDYMKYAKLMIDEMVNNGIEKCFIIRIGNNRDNADLYKNIIHAQDKLCETYSNVVMISTKLTDMAANGQMKDAFHYTQEGYNIVGKDAGENCANDIISNRA